jgi:penicillin-binding protein 2
MLGKIEGLVRRFLHSRGAGGEISPDEIFLDSANLPKFSVERMEGRIEKSIKARSFVAAGTIFALVLSFLTYEAWVLQVKEGEAHVLMSERNALNHSIIFAPRGVIYDRNEELLASNSISTEHPDYPSRKYSEKEGLSHILGYVKYPARDSGGFFYSTDYVGVDGVEKYYDQFLKGINGLKITETNALGVVESESVIKPPYYGGTLRLSIDAKLQSKLYEYIRDLAKEVGFEGGAGIIVDIYTGEIISLTSYPEFKSEIISEGKDNDKISEYLTSKAKPFLNRATDGLYTPGSIVKPFLALGALEEKLIDPLKNIYSSGSISVPNVYDPGRKSTFTDWKAHGYVDMRKAIAMSSNVYFYYIGGGFEDQKGLGISNIEKYLNLFGFGKEVNGNIFMHEKGTIPNPEWKSKNFDGDAWRIGDTYNTSIGQYGVQVTPMQAAMAVSSIANGGTLYEPVIVLGERKNSIPLDLDPKNIKVVQEGMRQSVLVGTASGLNVPFVEVAAKTGTAELGSRKEFVNSWVIGFFPYDKPKYAFTVIMEKGPRKNTIGALYVMRRLFEWMGTDAVTYIK